MHSSWLHEWIILSQRSLFHPDKLIALSNHNHNGNSTPVNWQIRRHGAKDALWFVCANWSIFSSSVSNTRSPITVGVCLQSLMVMNKATLDYNRNWHMTYHNTWTLSLRDSSGCNRCVTNSTTGFDKWDVSNLSLVRDVSNLSLVLSLVLVTALKASPPRSPLSCVPNSTTALKLETSPGSE